MNKGIDIQKHSNDRGLKVIHVMAFQKIIGTEEEAIEALNSTVDRLKNEALPDVYHVYVEPDNKFNALLVSGL